MQEIQCAVLAPESYRLLVRHAALDEMERRHKAKPQLLNKQRPEAMQASNTDSCRDLREDLRQARLYCQTLGVAFEPKFAADVVDEVSRLTARMKAMKSAAAGAATKSTALSKRALLLIFLIAIPVNALFLWLLARVCGYTPGMNAWLALAAIISVPLLILVNDTWVKARARKGRKRSLSNYPDSGASLA